MLAGTETLYQMVHDRLMPHEACWQDTELARTVLLALERRNPSESFFRVFMTRLGGVKPYSAPSLTGEWRILSRQEVWDANPLKPPEVPGTDSSHPGEILFDLLLTCTSAAVLHQAHQTHKSEKNLHLRYYKLNSLLKILQQLFVDNQRHMDQTKECTNLRERMHYMLGFLSLYLYRQFLADAPRPGRYSEYEIQARFSRQPENGQDALAHHLRERLHTNSVPERSPEAVVPSGTPSPEKESSLLTLQKEYKEDFDELKGLVTALAQEAGQKKKDEYIKPKEARKILNISNTTLSEWRKKKVLKRVRKNGNRYEYSRNEINDILKNKGHSM